MVESPLIHVEHPWADDLWGLTNWSQASILVAMSENPKVDHPCDLTIRF